jgi:protein-S-isoprenylcysteine O-methyltransferase Ste14
MPDAIARSCIFVVTATAFARSVWVVGGFVRTLLRGRSLVATKWGWVEFLVVPEPLVIAAVTYWLLTHDAAAIGYSAIRVVGAIVGATVALGGVALTLWSFLSLPSVASGHYILEGQPIVDRRAYGWVRHPMYLAVFMIWLSLAAAYFSLLPLLVLALYVIPVMLLYIREEEALMIERYGDAYRDYQRRVGGLVPHVRGDHGGSLERPGAAR